MIIQKYNDEIIADLKTKDSIKELDEKTIESLIDVIFESVKHSFITVLNNKFNDLAKCNVIFSKCMLDMKIYNLRTDEYESLDEACVINSSRTDLEIMKSTFSIIGLIVTSNQFISTQTK